MHYSAQHFSDDKAHRRAEEVEAHLCQPGRRRMRDFYLYWQRKCGDGPYPQREDIEPLDIPLLLPNIFLADIVDEEPTDFIYRLVGTNIVEIDGECTGLRLSEMLPDREKFVNLWRQYDDVRRGRYWLRIEDLPHRSRDLLIGYEVLLLPLQNADGIVDKIFGFAQQASKLNDH